MKSTVLKAVFIFTAIMQFSFFVSCTNNEAGLDNYRDSETRSLINAIQVSDYETGKIRLLNATWSVANDPIPYHVRKAFDCEIEVEDIGNNKQVIVHYHTGSSWVDGQATFVRDSKPGYQIYGFSVSNAFGVPGRTSELVKLTYQFALKLIGTDGKEYWDNNNDQNYRNMPEYFGPFASASIVRYDLPSLFVRGSFDNELGWDNGKAMTKINDFEWEISDVQFGDSANEGFKFDVNNDWQVGFGDYQSDGFADNTPFATDISVDSNSVCNIKFNQKNLEYTVDCIKPECGAEQLKVSTGTYPNNIGFTMSCENGVWTSDTVVPFNTDSLEKKFYFVTTDYNGNPYASHRYFGDENPVDGTVDQFGHPSSGQNYYISVLDEDANVKVNLNTGIYEVVPVRKWQKTVVLIKGETIVGQDMFIRGGIDHNYAKEVLGKDCTADNYECAVPIKHLNFKNSTTSGWKLKDSYLDWYGTEIGQNEDSEGTPLDWTTDSWPSEWGVTPYYEEDGYGVTDLNTYGLHYWIMEVEMDCSKTVEGWFELKSYISNGPGWESDISQLNTPYESKNHFAKCGFINVFEHGVNEVTAILDFE